MLASILSGSLEGMLLAGQTPPSYVVVPAGCRDLVRCMPRAFQTPAGHSPLGHTYSSAHVVGCRSFLFFLTMASGTNQVSLETSILLSVSFSFLATKVQISVTGLTMKK